MLLAAATEWKNLAMSIGGSVRRPQGTRLLTALSVGVGVTMAAVFSVAPEAAATPSCLQPLQDRYEPGDEGDAVGYGCVRESAGTGDLQAFAYLHALPDLCAEVDDSMSCNPDMLFSKGSPVDLDPASGVPLGQISLEDSPQPLRGVRASLTFHLPVDLAPGTYHAMVCGEPCAPDERIYSAWPSTLHVGVDPPEEQRPVRHWPLDDPAIEDLPDDALLLGPDGDEVTAAEVRAEARVNDVDGSQRVETAAPPADSSTGDDDTQVMPWIVAAAVVAAAEWVEIAGPASPTSPGGTDPPTRPGPAGRRVHRRGCTHGLRSKRRRRTGTGRSTARCNHRHSVRCRATTPPGRRARAVSVHIDSVDHRSWYGGRSPRRRSTLVMLRREQPPTAPSARSSDTAPDRTLLWIRGRARALW